jgi:hypothetical protein
MRPWLAAPLASVRRLSRNVIGDGNDEISDPFAAAAVQIHNPVPAHDNDRLPTPGQQGNQAEREEEDRHEDSPSGQEPMLKDGRVATLSHHLIAAMHQHRDDPVEHLRPDSLCLGTKRYLMDEINAAPTPRRPETHGKQRSQCEQEHQDDGMNQGKTILRPGTPSDNLSLSLPERDR